jgi:hypothetical protein
MTKRKSPTTLNWTNKSTGLLRGTTDAAVEPRRHSDTTQSAYLRPQERRTRRDDEKEKPDDAKLDG